MSYLAIKHLHMGFAALSFLGFFTRGLMMLTDSPKLRARFVRIAPHVVDTVLLLSALALAMQLPPGGPHAWLGAKVVGLLLYIGIGVFAFRGKTKGARIVCWLLAMLVFGWIVSVALTRSPLGLFAGLGA